MSRNNIRNQDRQCHDKELVFAVIKCEIAAEQKKREAQRTADHHRHKANDAPGAKDADAIQ